MPDIKVPMFSFAIIADTHIMPAGVSDTAPYKVLNKANQRIRKVVEDLKVQDPKLWSILVIWFALFRLCQIMTMFAGLP